MEDVYLYYLKLRDELLKKLENDPAISAVGVFQNQDFKRIAVTISESLEKNKAYLKSLGISVPEDNASDAKAVAKSRSSIAIKISDSTVQRIIQKELAVKHPLDKRVRVTLTMIAYFVGYDGWDDFVEKNRLDVEAGGKTLSDHLVEVVRNADAAEFAAYKRLPEVDMTDLEKYFIISSPAYKRVLNVLVRHQLRRWVLNDPLDLNPSTYDTYSLTVTQVSNNTAIVVADEWWYLRWFDLNTFKTPRIYNIRNTQTFTLKKVEGIWKVYSTEYPTAGALSRIRKKFFR